MWTLASVVLTFPHLDRLRTALPGDPGDAFFNLTLLEWGANRLPHAFHGYWQGYFFVGGHDVMAYSETHLGIVPIYWLLKAITGSPVVAMNLLFIAGWALSGEFTYRLARHLGAAPTGAVLGAFAYTYSTIRLGQYGHFQLGTAAFIPLVILLLLRLCEAPRLRTAIAFGIVFPMMMLSSSYYGVMMAIICTVIVLGMLWHDRHSLTQWKPRLGYLAVAGGIALIIAGPAAFHYLRLGRDPNFQRGYDSQFAMRWPDLRLPADGNRWIGQLGVLSSNDARSSENLTFPGIAVLALAPVGAYATARRRTAEQLRLTATQRRSLILVGGAGALVTCIAFGRNLAIGGGSLSLYELSTHIVPGMKTMRALVRLFVAGQLALSIAAAIGATWLLSKIRSSRRRSLAGAALVAFVVFELSTVVDTVRVPEPTAVNEALAALPKGITLELPIASADDGAAWAYSESPRLVLAHRDWQPRLNGYSGFWPPDYLPMSRLLNLLPSPDAIEELRFRQVRYLVIRTQPMLDREPAYQAVVDAAEVATVSQTDADRIVEALKTAGMIENEQRFPEAVLLTLAPG